jgi:hypothetical protein
MIKIEFSNEQVNVLYELLNKAQITGGAAKMIASIQTVIEKASEQDETKIKK